MRCVRSTSTRKVAARMIASSALPAIKNAYAAGRSSKNSATMIIVDLIIPMPIHFTRVSPQVAFRTSMLLLTAVKGGVFS